MEHRFTLPLQGEPTDDGELILTVERGVVTLVQTLGGRRPPLTTHQPFGTGTNSCQTRDMLPTPANEDGWEWAA